MQGNQNQKSLLIKFIEETANATTAWSHRGTKTRTIKIEYKIKIKLTCTTYTILYTENTTM